jgi:hypothetical protein
MIGPWIVFLCVYLTISRHALLLRYVRFQMAAESEVAFSEDLDGSTIRIGVLRTRWNDEHVSNLVDGIKVSRTVIIPDRPCASTNPLILI